MRKLISISGRDVIFPVFISAALLLTTVGCEKDDGGTPDPVAGKPVAALNHENAAGSVSFFDHLFSRVDWGSDITDSTALVIISDPHQLTAAQVEAVKSAYDRGSFIALLAPAHSEHEFFTQQLGHTPVVASAETPDDASSDLCDLVVFNKDGHTSFIHDLEQSGTVTHHVDDPVTGTEPVDGPPGTEEEDNTAGSDCKEYIPREHGSTETVAAEPLSDELLDAIADQTVAFVERYTGRSLSGAPSAAVKTYATTDIALKQHVAITNTFQYTYGGQQLVNENYYITGVYSYEQDADYYMVEQEVIMMNGDLKIVHEEETSISGVTGLKYGIASYGFSKGMKTYCTLVPEVKNNNIVQLTQASPLTSTGSASFTTGSSYNIGGNVGLTTSGPTANISGGITISSSYTTSIPDVSVTNKCISGDVEGIKDDNGFVEWIYDIAWPTSQMDYWDTGHHRWQIDDEPAIARNTAFYYNSWIWIIKHPTGRYGMVKRVYGYTGYTLGALNMWGYYYTKTSYSYRWYSRQIMFNQPTRVWNK